MNKNAFNKLKKFTDGILPGFIKASEKARSYGIAFKKETNQ